MFADQAKLDEAALVKTAAGLGMERSSFESCLKSGKYEALVQQDVEAGSQVAVNATPTFFINGESLGGARSEADFMKIIDRQLAGATGNGSVRGSRQGCPTPCRKLHYSLSLT